MRSVFLALLIASSSTPSLAQSALEQRRAALEEAQAEKAERTETRAQRRARAAEWRSQVREPTLAPRDGERPGRPALDRAIERGRASTVVESPRPRLDRRRQEEGDSVANWRREERTLRRESLAQRLGDRIERRRVAPPVNAHPDRPAPPPRMATRRASSPRWGSGWHNDHRFNWRDHRRRYGSLYRLGFYFDPFGWNYRRYDRGWRLWPSYYDRSYWLSDPFRYRLPHAPYPYQWVRYWDDALLVDTYTGEVIDVAHDFFW